MGQAPRKISIISGIVACVVLVLHLSLAAIVIVNPDVSKGSRILTFYRRLIVLGPFFQEPRIVASPHVYVSHFLGGKWTRGEDYGCANVEATRSQYRAVKRRAFEEYLASQVAGKLPVNPMSRAVHELENYLRTQGHAYGADSIGVAYVMQRRRPEWGGAHIDTVYHFTFKP